MANTIMINEINENNFSSVCLPRQSNLLNFSAFRELRTDNLFRSFSIKMVLAGCETYTINRRKFTLEPGNYLLANHHARGITHIGSRTLVKGLCIDISPEIMAQAALATIYPEIQTTEPGPDTFFTAACFPENTYATSQTSLGQKLNTLCRHFLTQAELPDLQPEFYYTLAECVVADMMPAFHQMAKLKARRLETRKDLLVKLQDSKSYIDAHFGRIRHIKEVADHIYMSEYHFFRLFRQLFGISPYQYLTIRRMEHARRLMDEKELSLTSITFLSGYNDLSTFSRAFKKHFGHAPNAHIP